MLRHGARALLAQAVEAEGAASPAGHAALADDAGRQRLVRNGFLAERTLQTGSGPVAVRQPRVRDRGASAPGVKIRFTPAIPPMIGVADHPAAARARWTNCCPGCT